MMAFFHKSGRRGRYGGGRNVNALQYIPADNSELNKSKEKLQLLLYVHRDHKDCEGRGAQDGHRDHKDYEGRGAQDGHRDHKDYEGRGAQDGHRFFHTAPEG